MKLVKSLLLGSAAGLAAVAGAQAADLPMRKAAPVEYVRVCSAYGVGFFYIPGTETCLRISGFARFEYNVATRRAYTTDPSGFRSIGRLNLDARTQTAYGTLRSFVRFDMARRTGHFFSGTAQRRGEAEIATGVDFAGRAQTQITLDKAFIQFAGITAGRATSFFDFYSNDLTWFGIIGSDRASTNLLAYTASFGGGFSATISMEDPVERRWPIGGIDAAGLPFILGGAAAGLTPAGTAVLIDPVTGLPFAGTGLTQRNAMPDVVANIRVDQAWGSAQLSGAVHQVSVQGLTQPGFLIAGVPAGPGGVPPAVPPLVGAGAGVFTPGFRPDTEYGYAIQGGVKINLPMIAPGDLLYLQAAYAKGALDYTISGAWIFGGATGGGQGAGGFNRFNLNTLDGIVDQFGETRLSTSWSVLAAFLHYWTPQLRSGFAVGYAKVEYPGFNSLYVGGVPGTIAAAPGFAPGTAAAAFATTAVFRDFSVLNLAANLIWSPVRDLDIGVEVAYDRLKISGGAVPDLNKCGGVAFSVALFGGTGLCPAFTNSQDEWRGRLRIHRNF